MPSFDSYNNISNEPEDDTLSSDTASSLPPRMPQEEYSMPAQEEDRYFEELSDVYGDLDDEEPSADFFEQPDEAENSGEITDFEETSSEEEEHAWDEIKSEPDYPEDAETIFSALHPDGMAEMENESEDKAPAEGLSQEMPHEEEANPRNRKINPASVWRLLGEGVANKAWFQKNLTLLLLIGGLFFFNIYRRYRFINQIKEIDRLEKVLQDIRFRALFKSSEVTSTSQKMNIERAVQREGLGLEPSEQPPYVIYSGPMLQEDEQ